MLMIYKSFPYNILYNFVNNIQFEKHLVHEPIGIAIESSIEDAIRAIDGESTPKILINQDIDC